MTNGTRSRGAGVAATPSLCEKARMAVHCCEMMRSNVESTCDLHPDGFDCPDCLIDYSARRGTCGLIVHDGGRSAIAIAHCPWCGAKLPEASAE